MIDKAHLDNLLEDYLRYLERRGHAAITIQDYRWMINKVQSTLLESSFPTLPGEWNEDTIRYIIDDVWANLKPSVKKNQMCIVKKYAEYYNNNIVSKLNLKWQSDMRVHVDWLSGEDFVTAMEASKNHPLSRIAMHLEGRLGLRRIEVLRLRVCDINLQHRYIDVLGKGQSGGKWRTVAFASNTDEELDTWFSERNRRIETVRARNPNVVVPDELLIYASASKGDLKPYQRTAIDKALQRASDAVGIKFSNHTLRRTLGRLMYKAGVNTAVIKEILGHSDIETTLLYIGINIDDQGLAMSQYTDYMEKFNKAYK